MSNDFDLSAFIPFRLNRISEQVSLGFAKIYKEQFGLTRPEWRTLANLGQFGRLTAGEICLHSTQHKTKVSRAVAGLEKRKWLSRFEKPDDRREEWLERTKAGQQAVVDISALGYSYQDRLMKSVGPKERDAILKALDILEEVATIR